MGLDDDEDLDTIDEKIAELSSQLQRLVKKRSLLAKGTSSSSMVKTRNEKSRPSVSSAPKPKFKGKFDAKDIECYKCGEKVI